MLVQPPSTLLLGGPGTGKTHSISTLIESGLEVFVIATEPTGLDSLLNAMMKKKLPVDKLHWRQIQPNRVGFTSMMEMANKVAGMDFESLAKLKPSGNRKDAQWFELLRSLSKFVCERDGKDYGPVDSFGPDRALVVDSLSGLNIMAMDLVIGDKTSAHQGEWGIAMGLLEKLINQLCSNLKCTFVLTAHAERESDEITGAVKVMAGALGRKLAPKLPRFFSEVVMAIRQDKEFFWSTIATGADLKARSLPLDGKIQPHFKPLVEAYHARLKLAGQEVGASSPPAASA